MTHSICNGTVHVRSHIRNGVRIPAYTRICGRHNPNQNIDNNFSPKNPLEHLPEWKNPDKIETLLEKALNSNQSLNDSAIFEIDNLDALMQNAAQEIRNWIQTTLPPEIAFLLGLFNSCIQLASMLGIGNLDSSNIYQLVQKLNEFGLLPELSPTDALVQAGNLSGNDTNQGGITDNVMEKIIKIIHEEERAIEFPYFDTQGVMTIGYGINVENEKIFNSVNWLHKDGTPMTPQEKKELYQTWSDLRPILKEGEIYNVPARNQPYVNSLATIESTEIDRLMSKHLKTTLPELKTTLRANGVDFNQLPPSAQAATLDMHYNLGNKRFNKFIKFMEALKKNDYYMAARESHRKKISEGRNIRTAKLLEQAALEYKERITTKR